MAKSKGNKKPAKRPQKANPMIRQVRPGLDKAASDYARLLIDPCNGPLNSAPFGDGQGGIVARYETDVVLNSSATDVGSYLVFVPGLMGYYTASAPLTSDGASIAPGTLQAGPGYTSLITNQNVGAFRTIAACLQVYYPGSEQNRAGILGIGQTNAGNVLAPASISTGLIRTGAQFVERTPKDFVEIKWKPNVYDMEWTPASLDGGNVALTYRRSALISSTTGIPISTGMRYRMVLVVEYLPGSSQGQPFGPPRAPATRNSFQDVMFYLEGLGNWAYRGAQATGRAVSSLYAGGKAVGQVAYGVSKLAAIAI